MNKTLKEIIAMADELNPNSYSENIKAQWVNEVESYLQTEIYNVAPLDVVSYLPYDECKDKELSLDAVNDKIYLTYLQAMIDFSNKEYQAFNNDVALYNTYLDTYAKWYVRTHGEGEKLVSGMYLSAYGIAVKYGFTGTEEEWVLSLKGERGEKGDKGDKGDVGANGKDGVGIDDIITSYIPVGSGATNVDIYLTDGRNKMFTVNDGYTPEKGVDYWTEEDKKEIISEIPTGGTWKRLISVTTEEEVNEINVSHEDFSKCKEFIVRVRYLKTESKQTLGSAYCYLNNSSYPAFRFSATTTDTATVVEQRCHAIIADGLIYGEGTTNAGGASVVSTAMSMLIGDRFISPDVTNVIYKLNEKTSLIPIGTMFYVYGKVEG